MKSNGQQPQPAPQPMPQQQEQRDITKEDIHSQQRAHLALRSLDLEAENVMLQQENGKLKQRIEELEGVAAEHAKPANVARADA
jgi:hypothetical protein